MMLVDQAVNVTRKPPVIRWVATVLCIVYGFGKLNGAQFTVLDSELTRPLGQVSGFWLTWYYFGFSPIYGSLIALIQIAGGILLAWPRTALLGALLLAPVMANIVLIDVFYRIDPGATVVAIVILLCVVAVIAPHADRLWAAVLLDLPAKRPPARVFALLVILAGAFAFTWWAAHFNNRRPTPIDGVWRVVSGPEGGPVWRQLFFERNRAFWVTFRAADGRDELRHFEVDEQGVVRIWETWLKKGPLIMQGRVTNDRRLELEEVGSQGGRRWVLQKE
jgi:hypothetical protein